MQSPGQNVTFGCMTEDRLTTVAFTGHRTYDGQAAAALRATVGELYARGFRTFLCGMAMGFDLAAAEAVLACRSPRPIMQGVMPCVTTTLSSTPHCWSRGTTVPPAARTTPFAALWSGGSNSSISIRIPPHSGRPNRRCSDTLPTRGGNALYGGGVPARTFCCHRSTFLPSLSGLLLLSSSFLLP